MAAKYATITSKLKLSLKLCFNTAIFKPTAQKSSNDQLDTGALVTQKRRFGCILAITRMLQRPFVYEQN